MKKYLDNIREWIGDRIPEWLLDTLLASELWKD